MTHDPKAVLALAQKMHGADGAEPWGHLKESMQEWWLWAASDALDAITPIIVAAEREACAVLCDEAAAEYSAALSDNAKIADEGFAAVFRTSAGACRSRAAAIRARKP